MATDDVQRLDTHDSLRAVCVQCGWSHLVGLSDDGSLATAHAMHFGHITAVVRSQITYYAPVLKKVTPNA